MYPQSELGALAARKVALQLEIVRLRGQCAAAADQVARPIEWLDRAVTASRRVAPMLPLVAPPLLRVLGGALFPRVKLIASLVRWAPLVYGAVRRARAASDKK